MNEKEIKTNNFSASKWDRKQITHKKVPKHFHSILDCCRCTSLLFTFSQFLFLFFSSCCCSLCFNCFCLFVCIFVCLFVCCFSFIGQLLVEFIQSTWIDCEWNTIVSCFAFHFEVSRFWVDLMWVTSRTTAY